MIIPIKWLDTYAISKYALRSVNTANFTFHDTPSDVSSTPGFRDAGFDNFGPAYEDWMNAETLLICGTDPYETKTILFTQWIMKGIQRGQKAIFMLPRRTAGVAYAEQNGGLWLDVTPGTDLLVVNAIARIIVDGDPAVLDCAVMCSCEWPGLVEGITALDPLPKAVVN